MRSTCEKSKALLGAANSGNVFAMSTCRTRLIRFGRLPSLRHRKQICCPILERRFCYVQTELLNSLESSLRSLRSLFSHFYRLLFGINCKPNDYEARNTLNTRFMRLPSIPTFIRTLYTFTNATLRSAPSPFSPAVRPAYTLKSSMPIPFLGALFSTAESRKMTYPVQKSNSEWQAQLNPGRCIK